ncbi:hypothetical protein OF83DRAFT_476207 [Amylostereum chailletii]|nr:hypothetical protein OF83DRAFT_476207 [Amylostereum chailletii]
MKAGMRRGKWAVGNDERWELMHFFEGTLYALDGEGKSKSGSKMQAHGPPGLSPLVRGPRNSHPPPASPPLGSLWLPLPSFSPRILCQCYPVLPCPTQSYPVLPRSTEHPPRNPHPTFPCFSNPFTPLPVGSPAFDAGVAPGVPRNEHCGCRGNFQPRAIISILSFFQILLRSCLPLPLAV